MYEKVETFSLILFVFVLNKILNGCYMIIFIKDRHSKSIQFGTISQKEVWQAFKQRLQQ